MNCVLQKYMLKYKLQVPVDATFFRNKAFAGVIKLRRSHIGLGSPKSNDGCPYKNRR